MCAYTLYFFTGYGLLINLSSKIADIKYLPV